MLWVVHDVQTRCLSAEERRLRQNLFCKNKPKHFMQLDVGLGSQYVFLSSMMQVPCRMSSFV